MLLLFIQFVVRMIINTIATELIAFCIDGPLIHMHSAYHAADTLGMETALSAPAGQLIAIRDLNDRNAVERNHTFTFFCAL